MSIDIVNLIESNSITKLNGNYQSKLVEKVKKIFSNYEQQLFLSSFYCYLKYEPKNDFVIDLDNVWKWLDFSSKHKAKELLNKLFIINIDYKHLVTPTGEQTFAPEVAEAKKQSRGGHNKEKILLNINTFKKFCLKAGTKKADEIHEYFIKLENIMFEIAKDESEELKQQVMHLENKNKETEENLIKQKDFEREKVLLDKFSVSGSLVYIIKVKTLENGEYIAKIGQSQKGIQCRYNEHKNKYEECLLLDCFSVDKSKDFESFIHNHTTIYKNKFKNLKGHEKENELFLIGNNLTHKNILKIIDDNINNYNYKVSELLLENELLKSKFTTTHTNDNELLSELLNLTKTLINKVSSLEQSNKEILNKLNSQETKVVNGFNEPLTNVGPRLQKINPETMQLIKVYECVTELMKEDDNIKRPSINKAVVENTIYCGYRWLLVDRELDPNIIHNIYPTKQTKIQNLGYISQLDKEQSTIINVFIDRKTAAHSNGYASASALDNPVKNNSLANGFYYMLYNNCDDELTSKFEEINGTPILYKNGVGKYDANNNLIKEFECKYDCIKSLAISDKTLTKALIKNIPYNGNHYKELGEKLKMI